MENEEKRIKEEAEYTFEELMNQSLGGIGKHKDTPKMHLWLPKNATEDQVKLVKKMIKG